MTPWERTNYGRRVRFLVLVVLCCLPVLLSILFSPAEGPAAPRSAFVRNPDSPRPDFRLTDLDGKPVTLAGA